MYQIYQVGVGETLPSIADKLNVSTEELKMINGISEDMDLRPGSYIIIPKKKYDRYVVEKGDTLYSVAQKYNVDVNVLSALNGLNLDDFIYPGDTLLIPAENMYITVPGDTVSIVATKAGITEMELINLNDSLFLKEDQIVFLS